MIDIDRLSDHLPTDGTLLGEGTVSLVSPDGEVRGPTMVQLSADVEVSIQLDVQQFAIPDEYGGMSAFSLMIFLEGREPVKQGNKTVLRSPRVSMRSQIYR